MNFNAVLVVSRAVLTVLSRISLSGAVLNTRVCLKTRKEKTTKKRRNSEKPVSTFSQKCDPNQGSQEALTLIPCTSVLVHVPPASLAQQLSHS